LEVTVVVGTKERGATVVEFAILLPVLLMVLGGVIDFGIALNADVTVSHAAHEGARLSSLDETATDADIKDRVKDTALPVITLTDDDITVDDCGEVTVIYESNTFLLAIFGFDTITVTGHGVEKCVA
jgi:Flp pilus assembly protein TadG